MDRSEQDIENLQAWVPPARCLTAGALVRGRRPTPPRPLTSITGTAGCKGHAILLLAKNLLARRGQRQPQARAGRGGAFHPRERKPGQKPDRISDKNLQLAACQVRRELIDLARQYSRHQEQLPVLAEPADDSGDPVALARWGEIHQFIAELPDDVREPFDLIFYQGLTQLEAAEVLGVSLRTLKRRWQEARLRLMDWLGGDLVL
jgi:hypothetical protein